MRILLILLIFSFPVISKDVKKTLENASELHNSMPDSSYSLCFEAEKIAVQNNDSNNIALSKICKVRYLILKNKLEEASNEISIAINIFQKTKNDIGLAKSYSFLANISGRIKQNDNEIKYLKKACELFQKAGDTNGIISSTTNLTINLIYTEKLTEAEKYLKILDGFSFYMPTKDLYYLNQNWGVFYSYSKKYEAAFRRFENALKIAESENMIDSKSTIHYLIGNNFLKSGDLQNAIVHLLISLEIAKKHDLIIEQLDALKKLKIVYDSLNQTENAYKTINQIVTIKDSVYNIEKINKLNNLEKEIALSEKQLIITKQKLSIEKQKNVILRERNGIYILIGILFVVIITILLLLINIQNRKKAHKLISEQKNLAESQRLEIENKSNEILSSINYAKRIQNAILPSLESIKSALPQSFVYYQPKDVVAGDFYWFEQLDKGGAIYIAAADCTGHGVPGAMVSVVCSNALNKALLEEHITETGKLLDRVRELVIHQLGKGQTEVKDGMDISLCKIYEENGSKKVEYSGANNPLYLVRNNEVLITKADKQPIGEMENSYLFKTKQIELQKNDIIYIFTDGYADQFGGTKGKKLGHKNFREKLLETSSLDMEKQKEVLSSFFQQWKSNEEQIDDVCIIGVRV